MDPRGGRSDLRGRPRRARWPRRAGRREPRSTDPTRRRDASVHDARDDPGVRDRPARERRPTGAPSARAGALDVFPRSGGGGRTVPHQRASGHVAGDPRARARQSAGRPRSCRSRSRMRRTSRTASASPPRSGGSGSSAAGCRRGGRGSSGCSLDRRPSVGTRCRARALGAFGSIVYWQGDQEHVLAPYQEAVDIAREIGDRRLLANALLNRSFVQDFSPGAWIIGFASCRRASRSPTKTMSSSKGRSGPRSATCRCSSGTSPGRPSRRAGP